MNGYLDLPIYAASLLYTDTITEFTPDAGVTIEGILLRDGDIDVSNIRTEGEEISFYSTSEGRILFAGSYTFDDSVTLANDLKTMLNAHAADGAEHFQGGVPTPDTLYFPVTEADATDWDSLVALTYSLMWRYSSHTDDGASIGGGDFHNAQTPFTYQLTSTFPIITLYDIASMLNDIKFRYNQHEADAVGHTVGSVHTEINSDAPIYGLFAQGGWVGYRGLYFTPYDDSYTSLGYYSHAWKEIWLNNDTTDGGTIHFNGSYAGSSYIQSSADGLELKISGFDDAALMFNSYCDGDILASPGSAIVLANSLKTNLNNHYVSRYGAHYDNDFVNTITEANATHSLTDLIALIVDLMAGYTGHDLDATLGAGTLYHKNSVYAGNTLASLVAPTNLEECLTRLADIKAKYNLHEGSAVAHFGASLFTETHTAYNGDWIIGNTDYPFKSLTLNNDATDGGAVYFNNSTTSFLKSSTDGLTLSIGGFSTVNCASINPSNLPVYDVTNYGLVCDYFGAAHTDNSPMFAALLAAIPILTPCVVYFPDPMTGADYGFDTTVAATVSLKIITFKGHHLGTVSTSGCPCFLDPLGTGWAFYGGLLKFEDLLCTGGVYVSGASAVLLNSTESELQLNNFTVDVNSDYALSIYGCASVFIQGGLFSSQSSILSGAALNIYASNNVFVEGVKGCTGGGKGIRIVNSNSVTIKDCICTPKMGDYGVYVGGGSYDIALTGVRCSKSGTGEGIYIAGAAKRVIIDRCYFNSMTTWDINIQGKPDNVQIRSFNSTKAGYSGINNATSANILGDDYLQPMQLPFVKGITNRGADIVSGIDGVKAIGTLSVVAFNHLAETLEVAGQIHTITTTTVAETGAPDTIGVGTTIANTAGRIATYFNRNSSVSGLVYAVATATTVIFYARTPGVAANAYTFSYSNAAVATCDGVGFLGGTQAGVDSVNNFTVDDATGNINSLGTIKSTNGITSKYASSDSGGIIPTDASLDAAFGTPASVGSGFIGIYTNTNVGDTKTYYITTDGIDWYYTAVTKAI